MVTSPPAGWCSPWEGLTSPSLCSTGLAQPWVSASCIGSDVLMASLGIGAFPSCLLCFYVCCAFCCFQIDSCSSLQGLHWCHLLRNLLGWVGAALPSTSTTAHRPLCFWHCVSWLSAMPGTLCESMWSSSSSWSHLLFTAQDELPRGRDEVRKELASL